MFDIAPSELLLTAIVAIVVIGPKDMPLALRTAGRWIGKMRRMSNHLRSGFEAMIREAELEEMETKWREQNAAIMIAHPSAPETPALEAPPTETTATATADPAGPVTAQAVPAEVLNAEAAAFQAVATPPPAEPTTRATA